MTKTMTRPNLIFGLATVEILHRNDYPGEFIEPAPYGNVWVRITVHSFIVNRNGDATAGHARGTPHAGASAWFCAGNWRNFTLISEA